MVLHLNLDHQFKCDGDHHGVSGLLLVNHKRKRPKNRRAGCLMCKYWKANGAKGRTKNQTMQERRAREREA